MFERLDVKEPEGFDHVHGLVEATKQAFIIRDKHVGDPRFSTVNPNAFLADEALDRLSGRIHRHRALPWPHAGQPGDTIWLGVIDSKGRSVSLIQSVFFEAIQGKREEYLEWLDFVELDESEALKEPVRISRAARQ